MVVFLITYIFLFQILQKGKVLFPNQKKTPAEISSELIATSDADYENKKPSLVVMGTPSHKALRRQPGAGIFGMFTGFVYIILHGMLEFVLSFFRPLLPKSEHND